MEGCQHFWVCRLDGYVEQCGPAICLFCGQYGCGCDLRKTIKGLSLKLKIRREDLFNELGIKGNDHAIEKELADRKTEST